MLRGDFPYPVLHLAFDTFIHSFVLSPVWDGRRNETEFGQQLPCCSCSDKKGFLFISICLWLGTVEEVSFPCDFIKHFRVKLTLSSQQILHLVIRTVFILQLVGFKQGCVMF